MSVDITLQVERAVAGGRMLARHEGRVVLVSGAIPGERVRARLERSTKQVAWAATQEVIEPSPDRREPACDLECGGSLYAHIAYPRQRALKGEVIADAFRRIGKIDLPPPPVMASPETGYRLRARLHVRHGRAGFFREGSHVICDAGSTRQLHDGTMPAVDSLLAALGSRASDCDGVVVAENIDAGERVLHLLPHANHTVHDVDVPIDRLALVTGLTAATVDGPVTLAGSGYVTDEDAGVRYRRHAASFFQANRFLVRALAQHVVARATGERCVDLYSGVGLFAVALAAAGRTVVAVEGDPLSAADLEANAGPHARQLRVEQSAVEPFLRHARLPGLDVAVLDPPRTGATPEALDGLIRWQPPRIVYVSCDPPTLARDAARLVGAGYTLAAIDAFDLFPNTAHVETVAVFTSSPARRSPSDPGRS
jgi:23S rRNA (uracil1939-C5)-methyltransferase